MASLVDESSGLPPVEQTPILYIGQHELQRDIAVTGDVIRRANELGYDMITAPITTAHFQSRVLDTIQKHVELLASSSGLNMVPDPLVSPLLSADTNLGPELGQSSIVAMISPWIDLGSLDPLIALISRQVLNLEVAFAAFCGVSNILIQGPISKEGSTQFARAMLEALSLGPYVNFHVVLPMVGDYEETADHHLAEVARDQYAENPEDDPSEWSDYENWDTWHNIRTICNYNTRLSIALELPRLLPEISLQNRWYSEPVRILHYPRTSFLRNQNGFPVLSKEHQQYFSRFLRQKAVPWIFLSDNQSLEIPDVQAEDPPIVDPTPSEAASQETRASSETAPHLQYMRHLQHSQAPRPTIERYGQGYQDYLQSPLQPLTDNLESITYEVFEKDPIKYEWYEKAVALALKDLRATIGSDQPIVVAVAGAGRGPLVTRVLLSSRQTGVKVACWAVEKNPNAHVLIQRRNLTDPLWNGEVSVVKSDMRSWEGPKINGNARPVDLFVSELLGSFADNELSPECLDGAQRLLHPTHGISIPQSYTAHFTPIASPKLFSDIWGRTSTDLNLTTNDKWDLPYVVMLHQYDNLATVIQDGVDSGVPDVKQAWSFSHPIPEAVLAQAQSRAGGRLDAGGFVGGDGSNEHNTRQCRLTFACRNRGACHGLGGYFETVLYTPTANGDAIASNTRKPRAIELSTNPVTMDAKSKDMISWFPIFFPLKTPLYVPDKAEVDVSMWRQTDDRKVWYEWVVEVFDRDVKGKRRRLGMSELHSSRKNGCLM